MSTVTTVTEIALHAAASARDVKRDADATARAALERGRAHAATCRAEVERRSEERARWIARNAKATEAAIVAGQSSAPAPAVDAKAELAHSTAVAAAEVADQVLKRLEAAAAQASQELAAAERAVHGAARAILVEEAAVLVGKRDRLRDELRRVDAEVQGYELNGIPLPRGASANDLNVPVDVLQDRISQEASRPDNYGSAIGSRSAVNEAEAIRQRMSRLIAGEISATTATAEAA